MQTSDTLPIAHCISNCKSFKNGIAKQINCMYKVKGALRNNQSKVGDVITAETTRQVYNLIIREKADDKPVFADILKALFAWREELLFSRTKVVAIPKLEKEIGLLDWQVIADTIEQIFQNTGINILVYTNENMDDKKSPTRTGSPIYNECPEPDIISIQDEPIENVPDDTLSLGHLKGFSLDNFFKSQPPGGQSSQPDPNPGPSSLPVNTIKLYKRVQTEGSSKIVTLSQKTPEMLPSLDDDSISYFSNLTTTPESDLNSVPSERTLSPSRHNGNFLLTKTDEGESKYCHCTTCRDIQVTQFERIFKDTPIEEKNKLRLKIRGFEQRRKKQRYQNTDTHTPLKEYCRQVRATFIADKFPTFRRDPHVFGRFEFPLSI